MGRAIFVCAFIVVALSAAVFGVVNTLTPTSPTHPCLVTGKDHSYQVTSRGGSRSVYRVYTKDCGTFEVQDSPSI
ncbi:hypothetical protein [Curtobacterium sp. MCBD17_040]|uniref:hypothetical protein n=1 Tax=Curtobacterium sp. MCBD17_040 TaxID=2175674 RepID=UPI000DAAC2A1|nr:hypothetical protein [Curtobacterium sp. MCBD17_040]WIB65466.1 hypothetical protein DEI94_19020 [Curtobacterium sp. MCBD17_040]